MSNFIYLPTNDYETKTYPESRLHPWTRDTFTKAAVLLETDLHVCVAYDSTQTCWIYENRNTKQRMHTKTQQRQEAKPSLG